MVSWEGQAHHPPISPPQLTGAAWQLQTDSPEHTYVHVGSITAFSMFNADKWEDLVYNSILPCSKIFKEEMDWKQPTISTGAC